MISIKQGGRVAEGAGMILDLAITVKCHPSSTNSTLPPAKCFLLHVLQPPQIVPPDNDQMHEPGEDFSHSANNSHCHAEIGDNS